MCSADAFREFLHKEKMSVELEKSLEKIAIKAMKTDKKNDGYTLDNDWTLIPSAKNSAKYSYKGINGYGSLLSFLAEINIALDQDFKPGNISPAADIEDQLKKAIELAQKAGKKIISFRADSAAHKKDIFNLCDKEAINFYISLDMNSVVRKTVQNLYDDGDQWHPVPDNDKQEWSETVYKFSGGKKYFRMLVLRSKANNPELFDIDGYKHHALCTNNDDIDPMEWLEFHNGRMASENYNKDIKNGFALSHCPSHSLEANKNYYYIGIMAFNIFNIFKYLYSPPEMRTWSIKTFRWNFVNACGRWIMHARKLFYRLINTTSDIYEYFQYILFELQKT